MSKTTTSKNAPQQLDLIELLAAGGLTGERREALRGILATHASARIWRGQTIIPPGSLLDTVAELFERTTDFPLEVPVFLTLHALAAHLLDQNIVVKVAGSVVQPDLWTTILAPSGSGKTMSTSVIETVLPLRRMPETTTSARFIEELAQHNRGAWFQDEWAQVLKRIESQTYAEEMRDYLLRLHDNKPIARRTAKTSIEIDDPALVIVGTTVRESFVANVSAESMLDGFMQRFQIVIGDSDPARTPDRFPIYRVMDERNLAPLHAAWDALAAIPPHAEYTIADDGEEAFSDAFRRLFAESRDIPASFFRRVMWRAFKYALVYHFLLGKAAPTIDAEDVGWAVRVCAIHLADARRLLDSYNLTEVEALVQKAEALQARLGRRPSKRELIAGVRGVRNAAMATFILEVMTPARLVPDNDNQARAA